MAPTLADELSKEIQQDEGSKSPPSRWKQLKSLVSPLVHGVRSEDAAILDKGFWLEALDEEHRYGAYLRSYHEAWQDQLKTLPKDDEDRSFFHWLDHGRGRNIDVSDCTQGELRGTHVKYCSPSERRQYEVHFRRTCDEDENREASDADTPNFQEPSYVRLEYVQTSNLVETDARSKWIFVVDLSGRMYVGRKKKGAFHHSSFVAGAPIAAAGKIVVRHGRILAIEPHSGHFKPTSLQLDKLRSILTDHGVDLDQVAFIRPKKWASDWPYPNHSHLHNHDRGSDTETSEMDEYESLCELSFAPEA